MFARFQPFHPAWVNQFHQLQNEVNRIFDRWGDAGKSSDQSSFPPVNLWEENDVLFLEAELPGLTMDDLEIYVSGQNQLSIKGERKQHLPEKSRQHRQERRYGTFVRSFTLPVPINADAVEAHLDNGVLRIRLPKHEGAKPRKIDVKG